MPRIFAWFIVWIASVAVILRFFRNATRKQMPSPYDDMRGY